MSAERAARRGGTRPAPYVQDNENAEVTSPHDDAVTRTATAV
ncbi:hypothetical protein ABZZ47_13055 [Streptomyces sp. NPDC006465]